MRKVFQTELTDWRTFANKCIDYLSKYQTFTVYDSRQNHLTATNYSFLAAFGVKSELLVAPDNNFNRLNRFIEQNSDWCFGYLSYNLKNEIEESGILKTDYSGLPLLHFYIPEVVITIKNNLLQLFYFPDSCSETTINQIYLEILHLQTSGLLAPKTYTVKNRISEDVYLQKVAYLKTCIHRGDIYEVNFCHEFYVEDAEINVADFYNSLVKVSNAPFSGIYVHNGYNIISTSPERFLTKQESRLISQPIKGTKPRGKSAEIDKLNKQKLVQSQKEIAENTMIVDLVRNDLSRIALRNSVKVDEFCKIYSFETVHQMISTVSCTLKKGIQFADILKATFPMGSMTGAPKIRAMQLIDETEVSGRGLFSGTMGYIEPNGNFDFNVLIRTVLYNAHTQYLSFWAGSAITAHCNAKQEYTETLVKVAHIFKILEQTN